MCSPTGGLSVNVDMKSLSLSVLDIVNFSLLTSLSPILSLDVSLVSSVPHLDPGGSMTTLSH